MQNWNQWQLSAGAITSVPQPPVGYAAAAGADPISLMQSCMQYYNQPAPSGYTPEQWAAAQQQNWTQWQQWQQQYQQWQAQYGDKYQQTMKHLSAQNMNLAGQVQLPSNVQPPPLPKEDVRPPLPPATTNTYQFANVPPPHQNNLPLFPSKESTNKTLPQVNATNHPANPPLPTNQPPLPPEVGENRENLLSADKCDNNVISESNSAKKLKPEDDDLTEAERTFDEQFQQWEEQFNKWKQQNSNHPDKTQYKQYEAKWTSWREKLIERREQMRKKREQQKQAMKAEADKDKSISGDDKILNILSNNENQRLINNLLGIGKTLGLTGKQNAAPLPPPPPPPPPPPETTSVGNHPATQGTQQIVSQVNMSRPGVASWSNQQQWINPQHPRMEPGFAPGGTMSLLPLPSEAGPPQMISPNFAQPPPNLPNNIVPNFSQPPPNFPNNDRLHLQNVRPAGPGSMKDRPPFGPADPSSFMHPNDRLPHNFDGQSNFRRDDQERFGRDSSNPNLSEQNQFRSPDTFDSAQRFRRGDRNFSDFGNNQMNPQSNFPSGNDRFPPANDRFGRENNRFGSMGSDRFPSGNDQFGPNNDRPGPATDRFNKEWFGPENDRFRPGIDRLGADKDHHVPGNDRFGADSERFAPERFASGGERFGPGLGIDRFEPKDRFPAGNNDRFAPNSEHFRPNDRFGRSNADFFDAKDGTDHRRDNFGANSRGFNRNPSFSPPNDLPPELKKLMEKRKAASDVFRPSFIDSDKSSSVSSLSESFKKIAGDSPFRSSFDFQKNAPNRGGLPNFPNSGPLSFQHPPPDSGQVSTSYGPRGQPFNRDNEPPFRGPPDFIKHPADYNERLGKDLESRPNQSQLINIQSQVPIEQSESIESINPDSSLQSNNIVDIKSAETTQASEADNTIKQEDPVVSEDNSRKDDIKEENKVPDNDNSLQQKNTKCDDDQIQTNVEKTDNSGNDNDNFTKKPESLPFMGENDPRPEDLNIEPPPELPNLCPITTDLNLNAGFKDKGSVGNQFDSRFNSPFGPTGMEFKPGAPFESRGPPPMFGPRDPSAFPKGPAPSTFQQQGPMDSQRGLIDRPPFGPTAPNEGPRRSNDEQYGGRDRNDELPGPLNSGQFARRDPVDERFGSRMPDGPIDRQIGPRGSSDLPFAPRNSGPFAPRGNDMLGLRSANDRPDSLIIPEGPFGPRAPNDERVPPSDTLFGTRRLTESQFGPVGPNRFGKASEAPFDKRPLFDSSEQAFGLSGERSLGFRRPNEGPFGSRGDSNDSLSLGSRDQNDPLLPRNLKNFNDARFKPRDSNDGPFRTLDFKARGPMSDSSSTNIPPWSDPLNRSDYMRRNLSYMRRGQLEDNIAAKRFRYEESPKPDEFNKSCPDIDAEMRKDGVNEYARRTFDPFKKTLDETAPHPRYVTNDAWKDKFGGEQRPDGGQQNVDRNVPSMFDERSRLERTATEPKIGDFRPRYGEPATGQDFQSKYASNLFMKRPQMRPGQEFCVSKQFNYNHGEIDKKLIEPIAFSPAKMIDYGHVSRPSIPDQHPLPVQCFDYSHGDLKPVVVNREQQQQQQQHPRKDFRNWVENEQNLKEFNDKMSKYESSKKYNEKARGYENFATNYDARKVVDYNKRKEHDWQSSDKRSEGERKENNDRNERGHHSESESRFFEHASGNNQSDRYQCDRSVPKERLQEIHESSRREMNKDSDKDDSRSKGSVSWQENLNKNVIDTKQDISFSPDTNVAETAAKTLELPKLPNHTMVDDLLCPPGRQNRPPKIAIILRGPPGSGKSFVTKLIKDKEVEQGGSAPRILSLDDYFLVEKEKETKDDNGKKITIKEMIYEYEEAMEQSYTTSLVKAFKKNITDGFFNFIILDCINEKISDYEEMWSFAKTKGFKVYICEMEMDLQICLKRNIHNRTEEEINRIIDYFEPTPNYHQKLDVNSMLQEQAIEEVDMEDSQEIQEQPIAQNEDSEDSHTDTQDAIGVSKWEKMEAEDKLDRLDGLAKKKNEAKPQTMEDFLQVPDYYNMEDTSGKKRVRWADLEERKEQEKMRAVGFVVGHTNWDRMMDPTKGGSALTRTKHPRSHTPPTL
ncbi:YLP motif-containing protein 1 isoform X3 [Linepithema humile]|uniref:YLP motif-containing protein 1 isoform X3 n=1 Tax=Linepithema humile TaxID=83485 RepID=UPI00351DF508